MAFDNLLSPALLLLMGCVLLVPDTTAFTVKSSLSLHQHSCSRLPRMGWGVANAAQNNDDAEEADWQDLDDDLPLTPGLAGFALHETMGFCAVFTKSSRATFSVVVPSHQEPNKDQLTSPEALTLVQLAGDLDLGTPILPPDLLARLVVEELHETQSTVPTVEAIRRQIQLLQVNVRLDGDFLELRNDEKHEEPCPPESTKERDAQMLQNAPKITAAVKSLPGLQQITQENVLEGMKWVADENGAISNPQVFDRLLDRLRRPKPVGSREGPPIRFDLVVSLDGQEERLLVPVTNALYAIGLALRYKVDMVVSDVCLEVGGFDLKELPDRFPTFRPLTQLYEDAKIMDGFIPSMFAQAAPDNDDKAV